MRNCKSERIASIIASDPSLPVAGPFPLPPPCPAKGWRGHIKEPRRPSQVAKEPRRPSSGNNQRKRSKSWPRSRIISTAPSPARWLERW